MFCFCFLVKCAVPLKGTQMGQYVIISLWYVSLLGNDIKLLSLLLSKIIAPKSILKRKFDHATTENTIQLQSSNSSSFLSSIDKEYIGSGALQTSEGTRRSILNSQSSNGKLIQNQSSSQEDEVIPSSQPPR